MYSKRYHEYIYKKLNKDYRRAQDFSARYAMNATKGWVMECLGLLNVFILINN